jgi:hypothetical protein
MAYYRVEPFGEDRADMRIAQLCLLAASALGTKGKKPTLTDFMLFAEKPAAEPQSVEVQQNFFKLVHVAAKNRGKS